MKYLKSCIILLLSILLSGFAVANSKTMIFEGTVGTYPIILSVTVDGSNCYGKYCYRKTRKDILLEGKLLSATQAQLSTPNGTETFNLSFSPAGYAGKWSSKKGKQLDVKLQPLDVSKINHSYKDLPVVKKMLKEEPYSYARTADLTIQKDSITHAFDHTIQWYHIEKSGVYSCSIVDGYHDAVLKKMNAHLLNAAISSAEDCYSCTAPEGGGEINYDMSISYLSADVVSIYTHEYYYCGGAHPDDAVLAININARTGQLLTLDDVLWFGGSKTLKESSDEWMGYREKEFAPNVVKILHQYHAKEMDAKSSDPEDDCTYGEQEYEFPEFYFTKEGLYLSPSIPHVQAPCRYPDWSVLPFSEVKKHLRPGLNLQFP